MLKKGSITIISVLLVTLSFFGIQILKNKDIQSGDTTSNLGAGVYITAQGGTGTSSPSGILYGDGTASLKTVNIGSNLTFTGGTLSSTGTGGGSGGGTWSTTTSSVSGVLVNYPNNATDVVAIGSNSTTTGEYWFDPNTQRSYLSGNVGIGTSTPAADLDVYNSGTNNSLWVEGGASGVDIATFARRSGASTDIVVTGSGGDSQLIFKTSGTSRFGFGVENSDSSLRASVGGALGTSDVFVIKSTGDIGIGTSSPVGRLDVKSGTNKHIVLGAGSSGFITNEDYVHIDYNETSNYGFIDTRTANVAFRNFVLNPNGGNVGIGTTSPPAKLAVQGSGVGHVLLGEWAANSAYGAVSLNGSLATGDANFYSSLSDRNLYINRPSGRGIFFSENNGNSQLVIASGGNVGVGTSSPNAKLSITGNGTSAILAGDAGFSNCSSLKLGDGSPMTTTNYHLTSCAADQGLYVNVPTNRGIYFRINNVDTMTLASSSTLGLGTTLPTEKFHIKQTNDGGDVAIRIQNNSTNSGSTASLKFTVTSNDAYNIAEIRSVRSPSNELVLLTDSLERLRINSTGVGIGTSSPYAKLSVVGDVVAASFFATSSTATSTIAGGFRVTGSRGIRLDNFTSCSALETNASGDLACGTDDTTAGSGGSNWTIQTNYNDIALTPSTTIPVWLKAPLYASSSAVIAGDVRSSTFTATTTTATSTFSGGVQIGGTNGAAFLRNGRVAIGTSTPRVLLDVGGFATTSPLGEALLSVSTSTNGIGSVQLINTNTGTSADMRFFVSDTAGNYLAFAGPGIGNTQTLFGGTRSTMFPIFVAGSSNRNLALGTFSTGDVLFGTNDTERMRIRGSNGNIGVGVTAPNYRFTLGSTTAGLHNTISAATGALVITQSGNPTMIGAEYTGAAGASSGSFVVLSQNDGTGMLVDERLGGFQFGGYDGVSTTRLGAAITAFAEGTFSASSVPTNLRFETAPSGSATRLERLRITASGNIGIGTTSPYSTLSVVGNVVASTFIATSTNATSTFSGFLEAARLNLTGSATNTAAVGFNISAGCYAINGTCISGGAGGSGTVGSGTTGQVPYYAGAGTTLTATSSIFIATSGNVGIGTTSPSYPLTVRGATAATTTAAFVSSASGKGGAIILEDVDGAGCTEITALDGTLYSKVVTCPAE